MSLERRISLLLVIIIILLVAILVLEPAYVKTKQFQELYLKALNYNID